jgi:hypothetical protein
MLVLHSSEKGACCASKKLFKRSSMSWILGVCIKYLLFLFFTSFFSIIHCGVLFSKTTARPKNDCVSAFVLQKPSGLIIVLVSVLVLCLTEKDSESEDIECGCVLCLKTLSVAMMSGEGRGKGWRCRGGYKFDASRCLSISLSFFLTFSQNLSWPWYVCVSG